MFFKSIKDIQQGWMVMKANGEPAIKSKDLGLKAKLGFALYTKEHLALKAIKGNEGFHVIKVDAKIGDYDNAICYVTSQEFHDGSIMAHTTQYPQFYYKDKTPVGKNTIEWADMDWNIKDKIFGTCRPVSFVRSEGDY